MLTIKKIYGTYGEYEIIRVQVLGDNGGFADVASGTFTGSEELTCTIWPGDDREATTTLPATWEDADAGDVRIEFPLETMQTLEVTWYDALVTLASSSKPLIRFRLEVEPGPGSATAPKVYHTYKDLIDELPLVAKLADQLKDQGGFAEIAAQARKWIDAAILRAAPDRDWSRLGRVRGGGYSVWSGDGIYGALDEGQDPTIAAALDADQLVLTTATGYRFVQASVFYTLGKILKRAVSLTANDNLAVLAADYAKQAEAMLKGTCSAEIDTNADGVPEYVIPLNRVKVRRA